MQLKDDRDIRETFHLSDSQLGALTKKTRQAINIGLQKSDYFKSHEWSAIYLHLKGAGAPHLQELIAHIRYRYPDWQEPNTVVNTMDAERLGDFASIVCVIADYRAFKEYNPNCQSTLMDIAVSGNAKITFYTSTDFEQLSLVEDIEAAIGARTRHDDVNLDRVEVAFLPEANQFPYMLWCENAAGASQYFICTANMFVPLDPLRGDAIFRFARRKLNLAPGEKVASLFQGQL